MNSNVFLCVFNFENRPLEEGTSSIGECLDKSLTISL